MKKLLVLLFLVFGSTALLAEDYKEGTHYQALTPQATDSGDKIEVLEFFWYGCPHCYSFEPYLRSWKKSKPANVVFKRVPAMFRPEWEVQARAYYALSNMNVVEDIHVKIFDAMHKDKKRLNTLAEITDFVVKNGVDKQRFNNEYNSFVVDGMVRKAKKKQKAYKIQGVPAIAVNGKYTTGGSMAGSYDNLIKVMDYLIQKESK
jgi:thiol:disulfide interchange protein DsbA